MASKTFSNVLFIVTLEDGTEKEFDNKSEPLFKFPNLPVRMKYTEKTPIVRCERGQAYPAFPDMLHVPR